MAQTKPKSKFEKIINSLRGSYRVLNDIREGQKEVLAIQQEVLAEQKKTNELLAKLAGKEVKDETKTY